MSAVAKAAADTLPDPVPWDDLRPEQQALFDGRADYEFTVTYYRTPAHEQPALLERYRRTGRVTD